MKFSLLISFLYLNFSITSNAYSAERSLVMFGGGGEPASSNSTIFDGGLTSLNGYLEKNDWNHSISFNGGHSESEEILNSKFPKAQTKNSFTAESYNKLIQDYEDKIKSGIIKSGDQLMLMVATHGAMKTSNESTHQVAVSATQGQTNLNNLSGATTVTIDKLKNLAQLAKDKGIKLAILDFSCHSGNSLALANETTCVITSTGPTHFGYNTFATDFVDRMKSGKTLEEVFLETRKTTTPAPGAYPMISTPEGDLINGSVYPALTPYLYFYDQNPHIDKMTDYLLSTSSSTGMCNRKNQYDELVKQIDRLRPPAQRLNQNSNQEFFKLKQLITQYKEQQDQYLGLLKSWGATELDTQEQFKGTGVVGKTVRFMDTKYTWKELLETDFDRIIKNVTNEKNKTKDASRVAMFQSSIDMHTKALNRQNEIISKYPNLKNFKEKFKTQMTLMSGTTDLVNKISIEEKKLYHRLYNDLQQSRTKSNPCKDFVL